MNVFAVIVSLVSFSFFRFFVLLSCCFPAAPITVQNDSCKVIVVFEKTRNKPRSRCSSRNTGFGGCQVLSVLLRLLLCLPYFLFAIDDVHIFAGVLPRIPRVFALSRFRFSFLHSFFSSVSVPSLDGWFRHSVL